jgi:RHS repeat-associated protein
MNHGMIRFIATLFLACLSLMAQGVEVVTYYHNDALGSPIIATDQEGRVVWRKSYAPYGQPIGQTAPNEPGYTGKFEEPDLGIQNFGARWYDPRIGRFLAIDPAGFDPQNPQSFNRYAYANNNPYKYVDPDGRVPLLLPFIVGLGLELGNLALEAYDNGANPCGDCVRSSGVSIPGAGALGRTVAKAADGISDAARTVTNGKALTTFDPPNDGFLGKARDFTLTPGAKVDRFGFDGGRFLAPEGTPVPMRALRPGTESGPYTTFTVTKPLDVKVGEIAPAYGKPGLGTQFVAGKPVRELIRDGSLEPSNR